MNTKSTPVAAERAFVIERELGAPRERVFRAWTEPEQLAAWWGPRAFTTPVCRVDARPGGRFQIVMRSADGMEYPIKGVYWEVLSPARIVMTIDCSEHPVEWHDMVNPGRDRSKPARLEALLTATFVEVEPDRTRLTIRMSFDSAIIRDGMIKTGMNEGWSGSLDRLAELLDGGVRW